MVGTWKAEVDFYQYQNISNPAAKGADWIVWYHWVARAVPILLLLLSSIIIDRMPWTNKNKMRNRAITAILISDVSINDEIDLL